MTEENPTAKPDVSKRLYRIHVGWVARGVRMDLFDRPQPPQNYTNPDTIERWRVAQQVRQNQQARFVPGVARLTEAVVLDAGGEQAAVFFEQSGDQVGLRLFAWLRDAKLHWQPWWNDHNLEAYDRHPSGQPVRRPWVACLHACTLARIMAYEVMAMQPAAVIDRFCGRLPLFRLLRDHQEEPMWLDPVAALLPAEVRQYYGVPSFLKLLFEDETNVPWDEPSTPAGDARLCYELCRKGGL